MNIDVKLLEKCPVLTDYEKDLIRRIDINHETQAGVAKSYGKSPATISIQHKKALGKFNAWLNEREKGKRPLSEEDFDKQAFKLFNKGWPPNRVIAKVGSAKRVFELWEKYRRLMEDDYLKALIRAAEYGLEANVNSSYPLMRHVDYLIAENCVLSEERDQIWSLVKEKGLTYGIDEDATDSVYEAVKRLVERETALKCKLEKSQETVKTLEQESIEKDQKIWALTSEVEELSRLRKYEGLTDEQIQVRRKTLHMLDTAIDKQSGRLSNLNLQVDTAKCVIFDLHTKTRETIKEYLAGMSVEEMWKFIIDAKWGKTNPLMARILKSTVTQA